jgi:disulfide bond formation protein DsbB
MTFEDAAIFGLNYIGWCIIAMITILVVIVGTLLIKNRFDEGNWSGYERIGNKR